jgi:hypoxanthine phosphoribosyltransferase
MNGDNLDVLLSRGRISARVRELGKAISHDYAGKTPLVLCVLKGAVVFLADLIRSLEIKVEVDFVSASSYVRDNSKGAIDIVPVFTSNIRGRDVLIIEDIIDTGLTCEALVKYLSDYEPASLKLCALLDKQSGRRIGSIRADYAGFSIPDRFVVGYGLDYEGKYRELPDICTLVL